MVGSAVSRLRILVNNAGGGGHVEPHFPMAEPEEWGATLDLNLRGAMLATQLALEQMARGGGGAIVNIASTAGLGLEPYHSPEYAAAKAGLIRFTSALAGWRAHARAGELRRAGLDRDRARPRGAGPHDVRAARRDARALAAERRPGRRRRTRARRRGRRAGGGPAPGEPPRVLT
jgi:hypothetical protein